LGHCTDGASPLGEDEARACVEAFERYVLTHSGEADRGYHTPGWQVGNLARVEVTGVEERGGRTILSVRRAPKTKKS
jgi:hypothetical protein